MGCATLKSQTVQNNIVETYPQIYNKIGILKVQIKDINFVQSEKISLSNNQYYIKLTLSNTTFISLLHHNFGKATKIRPLYNKFDYVLNKNQLISRKLQIQFFRKQQLRTDVKIGENVINIDHLISKPKPTQSINKETCHCPINNKQNFRIGWTILEISFTPLSYQILMIKVLSVILRDKVQNQRKVYIRMQIGEQMFESSSSVQNKFQIPEWNDAFCSFIVPVSLTYGVVHVYQKKYTQNQDKLLGTLKFDMKTILDQKSQTQIYNEEIKFNQQVTGTMKLQFLKINSKVIVQNPIINQVKKISKQQNKQQKFTEKKDWKTSPSTNVTNNISEAKINPDEFSIKIKKEQKSQMLKRKHYHGNTIFSSIGSTPVRIKSAKNRSQHRRSKKKQKIQYSKITEQNPQHINRILSQQNVEQNHNNQLIDDGQRLILVKTESILFQNKNNQNIQIISTSSLENIYKDDKRIQEKKKRIKQSNIILNNNITNHHQTESKTNFKNYQTKDSDTGNNKSNKKDNFLVNINSSYKSKKKNKISKEQTSIIKFQVIQKDLQSQSIKFSKNSLVKIQLDDGFTAFDLSLKQQSNVQSNDEWQLVDFGNDHKNMEQQRNDFQNRFNNPFKKAAQQYKSVIFRKQMHNQDQLFNPALNERYKRKFQAIAVNTQDAQ